MSHFTLPPICTQLCATEPVVLVHNMSASPIQWHGARLTRKCCRTMMIASSGGPDAPSAHLGRHRTSGRSRCPTQVDTLRVQMSRIQKGAGLWGSPLFASEEITSELRGRTVLYDTAVILDRPVADVPVRTWSVPLRQTGTGAGAKACGTAHWAAERTSTPPPARQLPSRRPSVFFRIVSHSTIV
jgi:hypothetical protein